ncbi:MAG: metal ABC transporter substrate-binding protein [Candidatus Sumerlaeaceae bacterium]
MATIFPLADWTREVGGARVHVTTLLPAGRSPHTFDPTPSEIRKLAHARLFIKVGLKMDDWGNRLTSAAGEKIQVLALGDLLAADHKLPDLTSATAGLREIGHEEAAEAGHDTHEGHDHAHDHEGTNPHYWLDVELAKASVEEIRSALAAADPEGSATYAHNAAAYVQRLSTLDANCSRALAECSSRSFVSFHNAYPYLAARYGLSIAGVIEEYPGKTPSEKYVKALTTELRRMKIRTVFSEPQLNPQIAEVIAREVGAEVDVLDPYGGELAPERNSYEKLIHYNVDRLKRALCGEGAAASKGV